MVKGDQPKPGNDATVRKSLDGGYKPNRDLGRTDVGENKPGTDNFAKAINSGTAQHRKALDLARSDWRLVQDVPQTGEVLRHETIKAMKAGDGADIVVEQRVYRNGQEYDSITKLDDGTVLARSGREQREQMITIFPAPATDKQAPQETEPVGQGTLAAITSLEHHTELRLSARSAMPGSETIKITRADGTKEEHWTKIAIDPASNDDLVLKITDITAPDGQKTKIETYAPGRFSVTVYTNEKFDRVAVPTEDAKDLEYHRVPRPDFPYMRTDHYSDGNTLTVFHIQRDSGTFTTVQHRQKPDGSRTLTEAQAFTGDSDVQNPGDK